MIMNEEKRYYKPDFSNLPPELSKIIFDTIVNTPKPNMKSLQKKPISLETTFERLKKMEHISSILSNGIFYCSHLGSNPNDEKLSWILV